MQTVLHCSSGRRSDWRHALGNVENLLADETLDLTDVELLCNGDAVSLATADAALADRVDDLLARDVRVCVCRNSLDTRPSVENRLIAGVERVPSGVGELTKRQTEGYAYIRVP